MRRLTLILSDLYLPEEARDAAAGANPVELPNLAWLLRFARARSGIRDWRTWLAGECGHPDLAELPPAQIAARDVLKSDIADTAWFATPVQFELRTDHVRLRERGLLRLAADEAAPWCAEFARDFGTQYQLHAGGARGFFLTGLAQTRAPTVDPARVLGSDVKPALGAVSAGRELFRIATEVEMWLHRSPLNAARERAGRPRISSLWLWGGGAREAEAPAGSARHMSTAGAAFYGEDLFATAMARGTGSAPPGPPPHSFQDLPDDREHIIVELTPMSGERGDSLTALESRWFAPVRAAVNGGALDSLDLVANDVHFQVAPRPAWRFWRRPRSWLEFLQA